MDHTETSDILARSYAPEDITLSDFDDALVSTKQAGIDEDFEEDDELDYAIDTSALNRVLPPLSDPESSDESEAPSIEIGRGGRIASQQIELPDSPILSYEDSIQMDSAPASRRAELPQSRLPRPALRTISNRTAMRNQNNLRKDAQIRRASHVSQKENLDPKQLKVRTNKTAQDGRRVSKTQRRSLSDLHARVSDTYEGSYLSDERPPSVEVTSKNTRFGNGKAHVQGENIARAVNEAAGRLNVQQASNRAEDPVEGKDMDATDTNEILNGTHESIVLPDMPDLSELVSGIYQEGIPVKSSRQTRSRTTRFASPPAVTISAPSPEHVPYDNIPIPEDEKSLFASLKMLQDKVSTLEKDNQSAARQLEQLQQENQVLRAEHNGQRKSSHNKLRQRDNVDDESGRSVAALAIERNRLEAANMALQNRLDIANHKISNHDGHMRRVIKERDAVMNKLGVAYLSCQDLRSQNDVLRRENEELQSQLALLTSIPNVEHSSQSVPFRPKEQKGEHVSRSGSQKRRTSRSVDPESFDEDTSIVRTLPDTSENTERTRKSKKDAIALAQHNKKKSYRDNDELFSLDLPTQSRPKAQARSRAGYEKKEANTRKHRVKKPVVEEDDLSDLDIAMKLANTHTETQPTEDLTFLTFIDRREIALLRKKLEEERIARKQQRTQGESLRHATIDQYSEVEELTGNAITNDARNESRHKGLRQNEQSDALGSNNKAQEVVSVPDLQGCQSKSTELTSAIILPDITIHPASSKCHESIKVSAATMRNLDEIVHHKRDNCFVCQEVNGRNPSAEDIAVQIPKPVPVSERIASLPVHNEEPTLRPSQPPEVALASVLKALEDELAHLKLQLTVYQSSYAKHDASLGKRQRKSVFKKIEILMVEIEKKSDQIYSLYDVLEGQKKSGEEMTDADVEVTLESLGIAANAGKDRENNRKKAKKPSIRRDELSDSDDDELPWEGFESTIESTGRSAALNRRHRA